VQPFLFELLWSQILQRLMGTLLIIRPAKRLTQNSRLRHADKQGHGEKLIAETTVKTLPETILPGTPRRDEMALGTLT